MDEYTKRLTAANKAVITAYESLNNEDPKYLEKLKLIQGMHQKIIEDEKNEIMRLVELEKVAVEREKLALDHERNNLTKEIEAEKARLERERNDLTKEIEAEKITVEEEKIKLETETKKSEKRHGILGLIIGGLQIVGTIFVAVFAERNLNARFLAATQYEDNNAFLTVTAKSTAQDALRRNSRKLI